MYGEIVLNTVHSVYMYEHTAERQPISITFIAFYLYFEYVG